MCSSNTSAYWLSNHEPKCSSESTRGVPPRATVARARRVLGRIGVTTVADVTHLDRVGIPSFITVRPRDKGPGISYYNGKGTTRVDAHAGALMEAVERHAGESCSYPIVQASFNALSRHQPCIDPAQIIVPTVREYHPDLVLEWVRGFDLINHQSKYVPLNCVVCPYEPSHAPRLFYASTNGLASGNTVTEALCHALCEVIERDAIAISLASSQLKPAVHDILVEIGMGEARRTKRRAHRQISLAGLPARAARMVKQFERAGLRVFLRDLSSTAGIATIDCAIAEPGPDGIPNVHGGCGTHPDAKVALIRALTEAAQSRIACIQGGREDLPEIVKPKVPYDVEDVYGGGQVVPFESIPSYPHESVDADVRFLLGRMSKYGLHEAVAFDLTRPEVRIPVVRVVVPAAEAWTVFHLHTGRGVFGRRVAQQIRG